MIDRSVSSVSIVSIFRPNCFKLNCLCTLSAVVFLPGTSWMEYGNAYTGIGECETRQASFISVWKTLAFIRIYTPEKKPQQSVKSHLNEGTIMSPYRNPRYIYPFQCQSINTPKRCVYKQFLMIPDKKWFIININQLVAHRESAKDL